MEHEPEPSKFWKKQGGSPEPWNSIWLHEHRSSIYSFPVTISMEHGIPYDYINKDNPFTAFQWHYQLTMEFHMIIWTQVVHFQLSSDTISGQSRSLLVSTVQMHRQTMGANTTPAGYLKIIEKNVYVHRSNISRIPVSQRGAYYWFNIYRVYIQSVCWTWAPVFSL